MKIPFLFFLLAISFSNFGQSYFEVNRKVFLQKKELNQPIDAKNPNYELLNAAIFHATNQAREQEGLKAFLHSEVLYKVAKQHSEAMISENFYSHINSKNSNLRTMPLRIQSQTNEFMEMAENIAQYDVLSVYEQYCIQKRKSYSGEFEYLDCKTKSPIPMFTYWDYAQVVVKGWMNSTGHRENILNPRLKYIGCAAYLSEKPYQSQRCPFARLTQNFGG
jgi:uncharacterized protein YkwD